MCTFFTWPRGLSWTSRGLILAVVFASFFACAGCGDEVESNGSETPSFEIALENSLGHPGLPVSFRGNFIYDDPSTLEATLGDVSLAVRAVGPGFAVVELPLDATTNVLAVTRTADAAAHAEANVSVESTMPEPHVLEEEPNDLPEDAHDIRLTPSASVTVLAVADEPVGDDLGVDHFRISLPPYEDAQDRLLVCVE